MEFTPFFSLFLGSLLLAAGVLSGFQCAVCVADLIAYLECHAVRATPAQPDGVPTLGAEFILEDLVSLKQLEIEGFPVCGRLQVEDHRAGANARSDCSLDLRNKVSIAFPGQHLYEKSASTVASKYAEAKDSSVTNLAIGS